MIKNIYPIIRLKEYIFYYKGACESEISDRLVNLANETIKTICVWQLANHIIC